MELLLAVAKRTSSVAAVIDDLTFAGEGKRFHGSSKLHQSKTLGYTLGLWLVK